MPRFHFSSRHNYTAFISGLCGKCFVGYLCILAPTPAEGAAEELFRSDGAHVQHPNWSPDGIKLSYELNIQDDRSLGTYIIHRLSKQTVQVTPRAKPKSSITAGFSSGRTSASPITHELTWSPKEINSFTFTALNAMKDYDIYLEGGSNLISGPGNEGGSAWSPNGQYIVFTSSRTGQGDLYLLDTYLDPVNLQQITQEENASELFAIWTHDSRAIVYVQHTDQGDNLWRVPIGGGTPTQLTRLPRSQIRPSMSPAHDRIAFYANLEVPDQFDLYILELDLKSAPQKIATSVRINGTGPTWTSDGRHIIYVREDDASFNPIWAVRVNQPSLNHALEFGTVGHGDLDVSSDAPSKAHLAFVAQGKKNDANRTFKRLYIAPLPTLP